MSSIGANVGELSELEISVGGLDVRDMIKLDDVFASELAIEVGVRCSDGWGWWDSSSHLTQNSTTGVIPRGDRIIGILHLGHPISVKT